MKTIKEFQQWFDERFTTLVDKKISVFLEQSNNSAIREVVEQLPIYAQKGKRFRPYMAYVGYSTYGGKNEMFPLLAAIEFLHLFCLVQDDIIDNEAFRHDTVTLHRKVASQYQSREIGRSVAMLIGDLLLAWSLECFQEVENIAAVLDEFHSLLSDVLHGQLLDVLLVTEENPSRDIILKSMYLKSAQYSFFRPLYIGMLVAGADDEAKEFAEEYAVNLGMGFQLQDDIADCLNDIKEGQPTLISWYMHNVAEVQERKEFELYFSKEWSEEEEHKLMSILEESGALSFATSAMEEYFLRAEDAIFTHDKEGEAVWQEIVAVVMEG